MSTTFSHSYSAPDTVDDSKVPYALPHASVLPSENVRLDDMHEGIKEYIKGRLSLAPLEENPPKSILELGSGSGAWALQAAKLFPQAEVLAVDLKPMPPQSLPQNLKFRPLDLTQPLPFERGKFDVVHARFVLLHLPHPEEVLSRIIPLLKPGGWLLLDDVDRFVYGEGRPIPSTMKFTDSFNPYMKARGADVRIAVSYERILNASDAFNEVHVRKVNIPLSTGTNLDPQMYKLGNCMRTTSTRAYHEVAANKPELGLTQEDACEFERELADPSQTLYMDMYLTWSRKRV